MARIKLHYLESGLPIEFDTSLIESISPLCSSIPKHQKKVRIPMGVSMKRWSRVNWGSGISFEVRESFEEIRKMGGV
jgi:hypothetical protein